MTRSENTGLNNILTDDQNFLCQHWGEASRSLEILASLVADQETRAKIAEIVRRGARATKLLQKGQPTRRRGLYLSGSLERTKTD